MSCSNPSLAVDYGLKPNGKRCIKFLPRRVDYSYDDALRKYGDDLLVLPCGKCEGCILARRKMWSLRCFAESLYHSNSCFVTLTYDNAHYPSDYKKDFQGFIKDLRNRGFNVRYYGCCEQGDLTKRFHLHIILFGFFPGDAKYFSKTNSGYDQFTSKFLTDLWHKGIVVFSEFSPEVGAYVAGYVDKKYRVPDAFTLMSKRPGLGVQYFIDHHEEFYRTDSLVTNFGSHVSRVPRYFDKLAEKYGIDISDLKDFRLQQMNYALYQEMRDAGVVHFEELTGIRERKWKDKLSHKKRGL